MRIHIDIVSEKFGDIKREEISTRIPWLDMCPHELMSGLLDTLDKIVEEHEKQNS